MGEVIDFLKYRENPGTLRNGPDRSDGLYLEARPPFITVRHYEDGVLRQECQVFSEHMLRDLLERMP